MPKTGLQGDKQLLRAMRGIRQNSVRNLDPVAIESLEPMRQQTSNNALRLRQPGRQPRGGHLDQGVVVRKVKSRGLSMREFWVSFHKRARKIAHLVEFGTRPHYQPRRGIFHPGARPKPFFAPAFMSTKDMVVRKIAKGTWAAISAAARRFGRVR